MDKIAKLEDAVVDKARVANSRTRPSSSGLYGSDALDATQVKELFDKYPDLLRGKLEEVIEFANALLGILGDGVDGSTITYALNSLSERVGKDDIDKDSRFDSNTLASAILKLSEDLRNADDAASAESAEVRELIRDGDEELRQKYDQIVKVRGVTSVEYDNEDEVITFIFADGTSTAIDLPVESLVKGLTMDEDGNIVLTLEGDQTVTVSTQVIADAIAKEGLRLEEMINNKLDKLERPDDTRAYAYVVEKDGTTTLRLISDSKVGGMVQRTDGANIWIPNMPSNDKHATPKKYVDDGLKGKMDKNTESGGRRVYGVEPDGTQALYAVGDGVANIARRTTGGHLNVPEEPTEDKHAASKKYVDDQIKAAGGGSTSGTHKYAVSVELSLLDDSVIEGVIFAESDVDYTGTTVDIGCFAGYGYPCNLKHGDEHYYICNIEWNDLDHYWMIYCRSRNNGHGSSFLIMTDYTAALKLN